MLTNPQEPGENAESDPAGLSQGLSFCILNKITVIPRMQVHGSYFDQPVLSNNSTNVGLMAVACVSQYRKAMGLRLEKCAFHRLERLYEMLHCRAESRHRKNGKEKIQLILLPMKSGLYKWIL